MIWDYLWFYLWLIPGVPLAISFLILSLPKTRRKIASSLAIGGQIIALALSAPVFLQTLRSPGSPFVEKFRWFTFGAQALELGWLLDPLAAAMLLMIAAVGLCIFIFSVGYMREDRNFIRFFAYLSFFSGAMLGVVIANSLLLLFVCWELVGLASYLLIGFWIERPRAAAAAKKAFITTRVGDLGFFLGILWLYHQSGTLLFYDRGTGCLENAALSSLGPSATGIALLIFCGAIGKSGQFPLHVWLPDAMEGPTPVSALIHAATMVAAGVFLVARVYPIFSAGAINGMTAPLTVVVWIGVITGLMAALIAAAQFDIKRILAYSTVSQLGLMMVSLGVGGVWAGIMHLLAHGFFKALLFLGAGSVIHSLHHEQDIRKMGGLRAQMPITFITYAIGMMALSGVPLIFAGAWTKEEILHATFVWPASRLPYYLTAAGVTLTAFYMTRQMLFVFFGQPRATSEHALESPRVMTWPLIILAICTITFSLVLTPTWPWLHSYLSGETASFDLSKTIQPMLLVSFLLVGVGIALGWLVYRRAGENDPLASSQPVLFRILTNRLWIDRFYSHTLIAGSRTAASAANWLDRHVWDAIVRAVARLGQLSGLVTTAVDERVINSGVDESVVGARLSGGIMSRWHAGQIQMYLGAIAIGMVALLLLYAWLG
jgi:NADH-quinone oxidoreductase subunit L